MSTAISFSEWMVKQNYRKSTAGKYLRALENADKWLDIKLPLPVMQCSTLENFGIIKNSIFNAPNFNAINRAHGHGDLSASLAAYEKYLGYLSGLGTASFTPEWFAGQAAVMDLASIREEDEQFRSAFIRNFGIEAISKLSGIELLTRLFYSNDDNKNNMCYMLEFHPRMRELYGSIAGGSAFKYGLFYHNKKQCWMTGSPHNPIQLTEAEAVRNAESIRDELIEGAEILDSHAFVSEDSDYEYLFDEIKHISLVDKVWALKYYQMLFPEILPVFYSQEYLSDILKLVGKEPCGCRFINMGMVSCFIKQCGISAVEFAQVYKRAVLVQGEHEKRNEEDILSDEGHIRYWMYTPGEKSAMWEEFHNLGIMGIGWGELGDLSTYSTKDEMKQEMQSVYGGDSSFRNAAHATWQFTNDIQIGDIVFVKRGRDQIIGRGIVESDYEYDPDDKIYPNRRKVQWINKGVWPHPKGQAVLKTLTDITPYTDYIQKLSSLFLDDENDDTQDKTVEYPTYDKNDFLRDVYMSEADYNKLVKLLSKKKNVILQGAPGVGKTYAAKRLAYSIMGSKAQDQVMMIQFHQSYSYEDFIMGFRPSEDGFELKKGPFYNFCKSAEIDSDNDYFFIIDEINRGNISKIFGEMFMLIESDKRDIQLQLLYSDEKFSVPKNVYIIGMMNTADRSLAMLDYALRRRFAFYEMKPGFKTEGFTEYQNMLNSPSFDKLIQCVEALNGAISEDELLGEGFCIGHSYFCNLNEEKIRNGDLEGIIEFELIPLLKEYWFDEADKVSEWAEKLRGALK